MTYLTTTQDGLAAITATAGETITADLADFIRALEARESSVSIGADGLRDALEDGEVLGQLIEQLGADEDEVQTTVEYLHDLLAHKDSEPMEIYEVATFHVPPANQGQAIEVAYGIDSRRNVIVERTYDGSTGKTTYVAYDGDDCAEFEPWNVIPDLGQPLGECGIKS